MINVHTVEQTSTYWHIRGDSILREEKKGNTELNIQMLTGLSRRKSVKNSDCLTSGRS